jgi:hypothetical protein
MKKKSSFQSDPFPSPSFPNNNNNSLDDVSIGFKIFLGNVDPWGRSYLLASDTIVRLFLPPILLYYN